MRRHGRKTLDQFEKKNRRPIRQKENKKMKMQRRHSKDLKKIPLIDCTVWRKAVSTAISATILVSLISVAGLNAHASTWSGNDPNDSNWTSNRNWKGLGGAVQYINLVFPAGAQRLNNTNDFPINTTFSGLEFSAGGYVISGNQIFLNSNSTVNNPGMLISIPGGLANQSIFNPNIILSQSQTWKGLFGFLRLNGVVNLNSHVLTVDTGVDGNIIMNGLINGSGTLVKNGSGKLFINGGANNFGTTVLNAGTIEVPGSLGSVSLRGGTLQGSGSVTEIVTDFTGLGGMISPGNGINMPGVLRSNGLVSLNSEATIAIDVNGTAIGSQFDNLRVTGSNIDINNANLILNLGFTPVVGQQFAIISQIGTGVVTGQFSQGTGIVENSQLFTITYNANSVVLTAQGPVIP